MAVPSPAVYRPSMSFVFLMVVATPVLYSFIARAGRSGHPWLTVAAMLAPTVSIAIVNLFQHGSLVQQFNPATQSWAFLFGDLFALTWTGYRLTRAWEELPYLWYRGMTWTIVALVIGFGFALVFRWVINYPGYNSVHALNQFYSRSSQWHDYVEYTAFAGGVVYLLWPVVHFALQGLATGSMKLSMWMAILGLAAWLVFGLLDWLVHKPSPFLLHPPGQFWPHGPLPTVVVVGAVTPGVWTAPGVSPTAYITNGYAFFIVWPFCAGVVV